ncbi:MAG: hypothetical protein B7Z34_15150 [Novosphingobium sp. 12-62-10]|nr:MAG: hypothetical protein B7Z34_15150 [Novosphingobium sp. 12-62-10]
MVIVIQTVGANNNWAAARLLQRASTVAWFDANTIDERAAKFSGASLTFGIKRLVAKKFNYSRSQ